MTEMNNQIPEMQPPETQDSFSQTETPKKKPIIPWLILLGVVTINSILLIIIMVAIVSRVNQAKNPSNDVSIVANEHENEVYFEDIDFEGTWLTDYKNIQTSSFDPSQIQKKNNLIQYPNASVGIDVSEHQGDVDWKKVADAGIDFAMIRMGWRGYETGLLHEDETYLQNIEKAKEAGLKVGLYFFSQASTKEEAKEEAEYVLEHIKGYTIDYPIAYDWERISEESSRAKDISAEELTSCARVFCDTVKAAGYRPMIYGYKYLFYYRYDLDKLSDIDFWLSRPGDNPGSYYAFQMWQYDTKASIDGIEGTVDLDLLIKEYE